MRQDGRRAAWVAGVAVVLWGAVIPAARSQSIIDEWSRVTAPPAPALTAVRSDPAATAVIVMDISTKSCSAAHRPRCVGTLPAIARLVRKARASGVLVLYSLVGHDKRSDIPKAFAARASDTVLTGAGPDKFVGTDLEAILQAKHIKTLIAVGTSAEGAVLNTASGAALRGYDVIVPVDGMSSDSLYGEQATAWYLAHAPRVSQHTKLSAVDRITLAEAPHASLTGRVSAPQGGAMEGVIVSATRAGSTMTSSVVSNQEGEYDFPASVIVPGRYRLQIRAIGYVLAGPGDATVRAGSTTTANLRLQAVSDIDDQMTNADWLISMPGKVQQKDLLLNCTTCHTVERIVQSHFTAQDFGGVMTVMNGFANQASDLEPQRRVVPRHSARGYNMGSVTLARFMASVNESATGRLSYPLQTLPRPAGAGTHVIYTEYALPRPSIQPHDVIVDGSGTVWFTEFGDQNLGRLDPDTGAVTEYPIPTLRPEEPKGSLDLETDQQGNLWISMMNQGGIAEFDRATGKFKVYEVARQFRTPSTQESMVAPQHWEVDGKVWTNDTSIPGLYRVDLETGKWESWAPYKGEHSGGGGEYGFGRGHSVYGLNADSHNNIFFCDFSGENIGEIDARTGKVTLFPTPTPKSRPRRAMMDSQDRLWFAEWKGNKIGMFDTRTHQFKEWPVPIPYFAPYQVVRDRNGELWVGGMSADRVLRMNLQTGKTTVYLLPESTNIRHMFVDDSTPRPTIWIGSNHGATIIRMEPLD